MSLKQIKLGDRRGRGSLLNEARNRLFHLNSPVFTWSICSLRRRDSLSFFASNLTVEYYVICFFFSFQFSRQKKNSPKNEKLKFNQVKCVLVMEHSKEVKVFLFIKRKYSIKTKIKTIRDCKLNHS